jgi:hypothetical protein
MVASSTEYILNILLVITKNALENLQPVNVFLEPFLHHMVI